MHVAVVGSGYVGLVAGACLAETGNDVVCVDVDAAKIERLKRNEIPIYEPGLEPMVERNQAEGRLAFTTDIASAVKSSRVIFIAVGTPPGEDGSADLQHVLAVATAIGKHMDSPKVVVTKSTVPVGTATKVRAAIAAETDIPVSVCSNPEFLKEGAAIDDFMKPDRVVIGVDSDEAREVMGELYAPFVRTGNPIVFMDIASAEVTKYAANAMLATRISFMNQDGPPGHRERPPHRAGVPLPGPRLRRVVLPQGREGAGAVRYRRGDPVRPARGGRGGQRAAEAAPLQEGRAHPGREARGQAGGDLGAGLQG
jgi:UDPglucose 6-dehydrogenase